MFDQTLLATHSAKNQASYSVSQLLYLRQRSAEEDDDNEWTLQLYGDIPADNDKDLAVKRIQSTRSVSSPLDPRS